MAAGEQEGPSQCGESFSGICQLALQGPKAEEILGQLMKADLSQLRYFSYENEAKVEDITVMLSRTGYTGEDGFELYCRPGDAQKLWNMLLEKGSSLGLVPVGLGARDTLRLEAALPLYGQELSENISPVMAGLQRFIKPDKGEFIAKAPLLGQLQGSLNSKIAGFKMIDRSVPRSGYEVYCNGSKVGQVTSGDIALHKDEYGIGAVDINCAGSGKQ